MSLPIKYNLEKFGEVFSQITDDIKIFPGNEKDTYKVIKNGIGYHIRVLDFDAHEKTFEVSINGIKIKGQGVSELDAMIAELGFNEGIELSVKEILAPMPGLVLDIKIEVGQSVEEGEPLLVLEAMKMENIIKSPGAGVIKSISVASKEAVDKGQILLEFE